MSDALSCGALAEIVVLTIYYAPEIGGSTASGIGAVHTAMANALGISVSALEGYEIVLTALGVASGSMAARTQIRNMNPSAWFDKTLAWASEHTLKPLWNGCERVWDQYSRLPGDIATLYTFYTDNGANGVALRGKLTPAMATGRQCLVENAGYWGTLMSHMGISYKAWQECRSCCDSRIRDPQYENRTAGSEDFFRNAPTWQNCTAVCNGLPHPKGDVRYNIDL